MSGIGLLPIQRIKYLFIDGSYFSKTLGRFNGELIESLGKTGEMDYNLLKGSHQRVFYYDCLPSRDEEVGNKKEYLEKETLLKSLEVLSGFHVYTGEVMGKKRRQKRVDILIALHMLEHSMNKNMQELTFIAGDDDFVPLIDSVNRLGIYTKLLYDPRSVSENLISVVDVADEIDLRMIYNWQKEEYKKNNPLR